MQPPYNDRWERTKRYLFRNLLVNPGFDLSPIPEEYRSDSSDDRPYSPLPDLIIEREPNRHDESPEFYQGLQTRMRRYYRKLFIDGASGSDAVEYEGLINSSDEDISEFEVNRSMASTFVIDTNNPVDDKENRIIGDGLKPESKNLKINGNKLSHDIRDVSIFAETQQNSPHEDQFKANDATNVTADMRALTEEGSKAIDTASDSTQDIHRISTTVAQIHEAKRGSSTTSPVYEDGSPILIPKLRKFNRTVFETHFKRKSNDIQPDSNDVSGENEPAHQERIEEYDTNAVKDSQNDRNDVDKLGTVSDDLDMDLEDEHSTQDTYVESNSSVGLIEEVEDETVSEEIEIQDKDEEGDAFDDRCHTPKLSEESNSESKSESKEEKFENEESIGPNEFEYTKLTYTDHSETGEEEITDVENNSIETAINRGVFESKNRRKTLARSTDEESGRQSDSRELEPVEIMRGTTKSEASGTLRRESTVSQGSPLLGEFATQATAEFEEEYSDHGDAQINASAEATVTQNEMDVLLRDSTTRQDSPVTAAGKRGFSDDFNQVFNTLVDKHTEKESAKDEENKTPKSLVIKRFSGICNDIWSVSPVEINFENLPPNVQAVAAFPGGKDVEKDRRGSDAARDLHAPVKKRKKYENIETQTSVCKESSQIWDNVKSDFFVGTPLIFKLCGCPDHICSRV